MSDSITTVAESRPKRGGRRAGAGRKPNGFDARWFAARGLKPLHAAEILERVTNEAETWRRLLASEDDGIVLKAMIFLVSMRDGKPAQQINITQQTFQTSLEDIARAAAIVRELVGTTAKLPETTSPLGADAHLPVIDATSIMLGGGEGGKKGG